MLLRVDVAAVAVEKRRVERGSWSWALVEEGCKR
jgi:hypothetical protein